MTKREGLPPLKGPDAAPHHPAGPEPAAAGLTGLALMVVLTGYALSIVDASIVNVALNSIDDDLHGGPAALELVVSGYGLTYALGLVLGGRLGDAFGRRRLYAYGLAAFTLTSALCGLAPTVGFLVAARLLQGAAAAMLVPQVLATIQAATQGQARARAIGLYGATAALGMVVGQILGGLLVSLDVAGMGWRSVFAINVPIGVAALLAVRRVPPTRADVRPGFDPAGTVLFGVTMVCVLALVVAGPDLGWPLWLWSLLVVAAVGAVALLRTERRLEARGGSPLLSPSVLSHPGMRRGLAAMVPFSAGFGAFLFVYALVAQGHFGFDGLASGAVLTPFAVAFFAVTLFTPRIAAALGGRIVTLGALVQGAGLLLLALVMGLGWPRPSLVLVLVGIGLFGVGAALTGPTLFRMILADVPPAQAGMGSGVLVTSQQMATALGATVGGSLYLSLDGWLTTASATVLVIALLGCFAVTVLVISLKLPDPR
ncbi:MULTISPECIES: MFS transporter [Streptomyces]|uniref:MFS family permease n=2 Tax=Streptomyces TaxID=1883 RepID=A0ABT9LPT8_STRGD|nr:MULTISPECIES: MFS transporter [Streptomyces]MDP9685529.1 MFS family permease [Streptomyces griseoviridis]GGS88085.1 MFS transporter [Streptomyces griseoviridis]GGU29820.1 MFS transporter [Streptomyces daghestanicus]GHI33097.1 MFS transporter [Streptomyces daghestanicus]